MMAPTALKLATEQRTCRSMPSLSSTGPRHRRSSSEARFARGCVVDGVLAGESPVRPDPECDVTQIDI
jgi:hypothetical protein